VLTADPWEITGAAQSPPWSQLRPQAIVEAAINAPRRGIERHRPIIDHKMPTRSLPELEEVKRPQMSAHTGGQLRRMKAAEKVQSLIYDTGRSLRSNPA